MTERSETAPRGDPPAHEPRDAADQHTGRRTRAVDVLVVGGGPGGLSCATELARANVGTVEVVERESSAGGIPRHSDHIGFGLRDLHRVLTGPAYAERTVDAAASAGAVVRTGTTVTEWSGPLTVDLTSAAGLERVTARAIVLATGARERPRSARLIPGDRPGGIFTTGYLQQAAAAGQDVGSRAVIVGAEHVSYSAAVTLERAGVRVVAMVTHLPKQQSYPAFAAAAKLRYHFPVLCDARVSWIAGRERVETVVLRRADGRERRIAADTLVLTGDWIPDYELARRGGLLMDPGTRGPAVTAGSATSERGVFATGNLVHPVETADAVAVEARSTARSVLECLHQPSTGSGPIGSEVEPVPAIVVRVEAPLRWVVPNLVAADRVLLPDRRRMTIWSDDFANRPVLDISQGTTRLARIPLGQTVVPNRPYRVLADWMANVRRGSEDSVTIRLV